MSATHGHQGASDTLWQRIERTGPGRFLRRWARYGTEGYPPRTARRLATINIVSLLLSIIAAPFPFFYIYFDWWGLIIPLLTLTPQVLVYAITPLWNRVGPVASALYLSSVGVAYPLWYTYLFGRESGLHYYFLPTVAASLLVFGPERLRHSLVFLVIAMFGFLLTEMVHVAPAPFLNVDPALLQILYFSTLPGAFLIIYVTVYFALSEAARAEDALEREHIRSETLLDSLLPRSVADRLKAEPQVAVADALPAATILFADIVSFTPRAARLPPAELLGFLNEMFGKMDMLTARHGLEKIKTVGDAYMAAAGLNEGALKTETQVNAALRLAQDMHALAAGTRLAGEPVQLRIGIHTGPVMAGVIGSGRLAYDIWGDTVNLAARMEDTAPLGATQVTEAVVTLAGDSFTFTRCPPRPVKGYGELATWLVSSAPPLPVVHAGD